MAITWQTPGSIAYSSPQGASSISVGYPASNAEGEKLVLIIGMKPSTANSGSVTTPGSWNSVTSITGAGGYGTTLGADTGNTNLFVYERTVPAGGLSGSLSVEISNNNVCWAFMSRLTNSTNYVWDSIAASTGSDTVAGNVDITFASNPGVTANDYIIAAMCTPTDVGGGTQFSAQAFVQTGASFGTVSEINEPYTNTGNDIGGFSCRASVSSGTGSVAPQMTATAGGTTTNVRGPGVFIRIREKNNLVTLTGNSCNQPNTSTTGAVTQERNLLGNNCNQTNTTTTGEVSGPKTLTGNNCNQSNTASTGGIGLDNTRYWVGGTGNWDGTDTSHWSINSGGSGGASVPTSTLSVIFDVNSNSGTSSFTVTVQTADANCLNYQVATLDGAMTLEQNGKSIIAYGNIECPTSNYTHNGNGGNQFYLRKASSSATIKWDAATTGCNFWIDGSANYSLTSNLTSGSFRVEKGSLDFANFNANIHELFSISTETRTISLGNGVISIRNSLSFSLGTLTLNRGQSTIRMVGNSFNGGGKSFYYLENACTSGHVWVDSNNTFYDLKRSSANNGVGFQFNNGTTTVFESLTLRGTSGNLLLLGGQFNSYPWTISVASGIVSLDYLDLNYSTATGGATFYAGSHSNNGGNNYNWFFSDPAIDLTGNNCQQVNQTTTGAITKTYELTGNNCQQANQTTTGAISQTHNIVGNNCQQVNQSTTGSIAVVNTLTGNNSQQINQSTSGSITRTQTITGNNCQQVNQSTADAITQTIALQGNSCQQVNQSTTGQVTREQTLTGNNCQQVNQSPSEAISQTLNLTANDCQQLNQSTSGQVTRTQTLSGNNCQQVNQSTNAAITQTHNIHGNDCQQTNQSTSDAVSQTHIVSGNNCNQVNQSTTGAISLTISLLGNSCNQVNQTTSSSISQSHIISANDCQQLNQTNTGSISLNEELLGNNVRQVNESTSASISQTHLLIGSNVQQTNLSTSGAINKTWTLTGNDCQQVNESTAGAISQAHQLLGASCTQANQSTSSAIVQTQELTGNSVFQSNSSTQGAISQTHLLSGANCQQTNQTTTGSVGGTITLLGNDVRQFNESTSAAINLTLTLTANNCQQLNQTSDGSIAQAHNIYGNNVRQLNACTSAAIGQAGDLLGNSVMQQNRSSTGFITQTQYLAANSVQQVNQSSTGAIAIEYVLTGNSVRQSNQSSVGAVEQIHQLHGLNANQFNRSSTGVVVVQGKLMGANCIQQNTTSSDRIFAHPVENAPIGTAFERYRFNPNRPKFISTTRPDNTNVIGPL